MLVCVVIVYWASAHSILLQVMQLLMMMLLLIDMIVWVTGTTVMRGPAMIRHDTSFGFPLNIM